MKKITLMIALVGLSAQAAQFTGKPPIVNAKLINTGSRCALVTVYGLKTLKMNDTDVPSIMMIVGPKGSGSESIIIDNQLIDGHYKAHGASWSADRVYIEAKVLTGDNRGKVASIPLPINDKTGHQYKIELTGC